MSKFDSVNSGSRITLEWVQSLPEEFKKEIVYRLFTATTSQMTPEELYAFNLDLYAMIKSGTLIDSTESTAEKT